MNKWQEQVRTFHEAVIGGPTSPARPELRDAELRARLILEEAFETTSALVGVDRARRLVEDFQDKLRRVGADGPDLVEAIDGVCDLIYVALGTAEAIGVDLDPFFDAVHDANMQKTGQAVNAHGKRGGKPPGWESPNKRIASLLRLGERR